MREYITVINFKQYQHYNKTKVYTTSPPWIKLYTSMLNSYPLCTLDDHLRFHAIGILLLAGSYNNQIPFDAKLIQEKLRAKQPIDLQALIDAEFIKKEGVDNSLILENPRTDTDTDTEKDCLKIVAVDCVDYVDNFLDKSARSLGNKWFDENSSNYAWMWTDSQVEQLATGLRDSGYLSISKKPAEILIDEAAYTVFHGTFSKTRPVEKAINALLKVFKVGRWNTPAGYV